MENPKNRFNIKRQWESNVEAIEPAEYNCCVSDQFAKRYF